MAIKEYEPGKWMFYGAISRNGIKIKRYKKRGFTSATKARKAEQRYRIELEDNLDKELSQEIPFTELRDKYLAGWKKTVKESSYKAELEIWNKIARETVGLDLMSSDDLQKYISNCDKNHSKNYVSRIYNAFSKAFKYGIQQDLIDKNPMNKVYKEARKDEKKKEILFFEPEEFDHYLSGIKDPRDRAMFSCLYYMGLRKGEMMALQWHDIDFKRKTLSVDKTTNTRLRASGTLVTTPKTKNSYRVITMPDVFIKELASWKKIQTGFIGYNEDFFIFGDAKPIPAETLRQRHIRYTREAKIRGYDIPQITIHGFRHSHASFLINNMNTEFTDFDIAKRLGDTVETLHETYFHWFKAGDQSIVNLMNNKI